jgi:hypothetical protein
MRNLSLWNTVFCGELREGASNLSTNHTMTNRDCNHRIQFVFLRKQFNAVGLDCFRIEIYSLMTVSGYRNVTVASVWGKRGVNSSLLYIGHVGHISLLQEQQY